MAIAAIWTWPLPFGKASKGCLWVPGCCDHMRPVATGLAPHTRDPTNEEPLLLGAIYAAFGALTFALNNATLRRGVVTGTVLQGMAITVPLGALTFVVLALVNGTIGQVPAIPAIAMLWLVGQGIVHFVLGRYCNYRANQLMGVNLSAPVVQLQVPWAILLAVITMHERFTVLQAIGSALMLGGSFTVQRNANKPKATAGANSPAAAPKAFEPKVLSGYLFGLAAAVFYGTSPLMARQAFLAAPGISTAAGGVVAYLGAMAAFCLVLIMPSARQGIRQLNLNNMWWFFAAAVLVAISQAFVYASLAVAPLIVVTPILQLSLVFRLFLSEIINKDHEVMNAAVIAGAAAAVTGSILVSLDTKYAVSSLGLPSMLASLLDYALAGG